MNRYLVAISENVIYFVINTVFFLAVTPVSMHIMGVEFFGLWSILNAIVFLTGVGTLGTGAIINKFAAEMRESEVGFRIYSSEVISAGIVIVLPMAVIMAIVLAALRYVIAANLDVSPALQMQFRVAMLFVAAAIFPQFLSRIPQGFLLSQYRNGLVRRIETTYSILLWVGAVLLALFKRDLTLLALWCLLDAILLLSMYAFVLRRMTNFKFCLNPALLKRMLGFSGFLFIESVAITLFQHMDRVIVGFVLGPAAAGIYAVGTSVGLRLAIVTGQATDVMIPYASLKASANDESRLYAVFRKLSKYISLLVAGLGGILVLWMSEILSLWISPAYAASYSDMYRLFVVGYGLLSLSRPAHQTLTGIGKVKITSLIYSTSTMVMLISLYFLSRFLGFLGAALANCVPALLLAMNWYAYHRMTRGKGRKEFFTDLTWGLFLPVLLLALVLLEPLLWLKILLTLLLGIFIGWMLLKDDWARPWLIHQSRRVAHRFLPYA